MENLNPSEPPADSIIPKGPEIAQGGPENGNSDPPPAASKETVSKEPVPKTRSRRRVVMIAEPEEEASKHERGDHLASTVTSIGRTPRAKGPVKKEIHSVDSTDGVKLCVRTWPGQLIETDVGVASKKLLIVIVHQYSVMGGCQDLVTGLARHLNALAYSCVTFDQRGVGGSTGSKSITGGPEVDDVISVCQWAVEKYGRRLLLVGSSAGAPIAGSALDAVDAVDGYVAIGYVFGFWASILFGNHYQKVLDSSKPKLFIMGTKDGFTTPAQLHAKLAKAKGKNEVHLIEGFGHFEIESPDFDEPLAVLTARFAESAQELDEHF